MSGIATGAFVPAHQPGPGVGDPLLGGGNRPRWRDSLTDRHWPIFVLDESDKKEKRQDEKEGLARYAPANTDECVP
jgi:hypothetical protein